MLNSLNNNMWVDYLEAPNPVELRELIRSIKLPNTILTIYWDGKNHVAWINAGREFQKRRLNHGSSSRTQNSRRSVLE